MCIGKIITSAWKGSGKCPSIDFLNATHTSALFLLAQFINFMSIESNLIQPDLVPVHLIVDGPKYLMVVWAISRSTPSGSIMEARDERAATLGAGRWKAPTSSSVILG